MNDKIKLDHLQRIKSCCMGRILDLSRIPAGESEELCPKCRRPMNCGNSPNSEECTETDDDEGVCEAYAKLAACGDVCKSGLLSTAAAINAVIETFDRLSIPAQSTYGLRDAIIAAWPEKRLK